MNHKKAKNNNSGKCNVIVEKGKKEKEQETTKGRKCDYARRKGKRANTCNELKEGNKEKEHREDNKNNKWREERESGVSNIKVE